MSVVSEAFAAGWAVHGPVPLPARALLGHRIALELAGDDPDGPARVFEAAKRDGMLATLEERRGALRGRNNEALLALMPALAKAFPTRAFVRSTRADLRARGLFEDAEEDERRRRRVKAEAVVALMALLRRRRKLAASWAAVIARARAEALAEGWAQGRFLVAELTHTAAVDLDELYKETLAELERLGSYADGVNSWLEDELHGLAGDVGEAIASAIGRGATRDETVAAVNDVLAAGDGAAFYLDEALHVAMHRAAMSAYQQAAVGYVDFQTEDDSRVCPTCQGYEDANPWEIGQAPGPPIHGRCRCWVVPAVI